MARKVYQCKIDDCKQCFDTLDGLGYHLSEVHDLNGIERIEKYVDWGYKPAESTLIVRLWERTKRIDSYDQGGL